MHLTWPSNQALFWKQPADGVTGQKRKHPELGQRQLSDNQRIFFIQSRIEQVRVRGPLAVSNP
jgi:hypothetical protein